LLSFSREAGIQALESETPEYQEVLGSNRYWLSHFLFWLGKRLVRYTFPKIGHASALMDPAQLAIIEEFLRR
jgi:hypothetical protein